jgi:hypothetical protein
MIWLILSLFVPFSRKEITFEFVKSHISHSGRVGIYSLGASTFISDSSMYNQIFFPIDCSNSSKIKNLKVYKLKQEFSIFDFVSVC